MQKILFNCAHVIEKDGGFIKVNWTWKFLFHLSQPDYPLCVMGSELYVCLKHSVNKHDKQNV